MDPRSYLVMMDTRWYFDKRIYFETMDLGKYLVMMDT